MPHTGDILWCAHCNADQRHREHFVIYHPNCEVCVTSAGYAYPYDENDLNQPIIRAISLTIEATHLPPKLPNTYQGFNPERYFGVEIECVGMSQRVRYALQDMDVDGVELVHDGSINHYTGRRSFRGYGSGCEIRLGPWSAFEGGLDYLSRICDVLVHNRVSVNTTCGLHVHHDLGEYGTNDKPRMARIRNLYTRYSHAIELFLSPTRWKNSYCQSMLAARPGYGGEFDRYVAVNGVTDHGTVEYRQHQGSVSFNRIKNWIILTNMLTEYAVKCGRPIGTNPPASPLQHMWKRLIVPGDELGIECKRFYTREMRRLAKHNLKPIPRMPMTVSELEFCKYGTRAQPQMVGLS